MLDTTTDKPIRVYKKRNLETSYKDKNAYASEYYQTVISKRNAIKSEYNKRIRNNYFKALLNSKNIKITINHSKIMIDQLEKQIKRKQSLKNKFERGLIIHTKRKEQNTRNIEKLKILYLKLELINPHNPYKKSMENKDNEKTNI